MFYLITNGVVVDIQPDQSKPLPEGSFWVDAAEGSANINDLYANFEFKAPPTPQEQTVDISAVLMARRDTENQKNITVDGVEYFADNQSQNLINQTLSSQERGITTVFPANWIMPDGSLKVVQYADLVAVNGAVVTRTAANFANYYNLLVQLSSAADPTTVDITQGWS